MGFRDLSFSLTMSILAASGSFAAQQPQPQDKPTFSVQTQLIQIFLTVQEGSRRVTGLDVSKFSVTEDGKARPIDHMDSEQVPLQVALLLDTSQSMTESLKETQEAASLFVHSLKPGDRVTLIPFNSNIRTVPQLTDDFEPVLAAIRSTRASDKTKLYDAILYALKVLSEKEGRKAIAVFSDGEDTASTATLPVVINSASRFGYPIYGVCRGRETTSQDYRRMLRQLAETNGGKAYFAEDPTDLGSAFLEISAELRAAYVLYYYTLLSPDDRWHELIVNVAHPGYRVYCRRGFFLARAGSVAGPVELPKDLEKVRAAGGMDPAAAGESAKAALAEVTTPTETPRPVVRASDSQVTVSTSKSKSSESKQPTFKVESRMVQVPVFLESTNSKPLPLFAAKDFSVFEDGSKKEIEYFRAVVNLEDLSKARDTAAKSAGAASSQDKALWNPSEDDQLTLGKYYLVLDNVTTNVTTLAKVKEAAEQLIRKYHNPVQPFSVYFTSGGGSAPGADIETMVAEIRKASAGMNRGAGRDEGINAYQAYLIERGDQQAHALGELLIASQLELKWENFSGRVDGGCISGRQPCDPKENENVIMSNLRARVQEQVAVTRQYTGQALNGLRAAVARAAADQGDYSKTIIFISPGFIAGKGALSTAARELQSIAVAAKQRRIKILTIDTGASALDAAPLNLDIGLRAAAGLQLQMPLIQGYADQSRIEKSMSLDLLSMGSGSKRIKAGNDIAGTLSSAVSSSGALYHLAYLSQQPTDGRYHRISVKVASHSVRVLARQGYFARPEMERAAAPSIAMSDEEVRATLGRAQDALKNQDYATAVNALEALKWKLQDQTNFWYNLGVAYFNLKDAVKASDALQRAWALSPEDRSTGLALSRALAAAGNSDAAVQTLQTMRARNPMDLDLVIQLGRLYEAASQPARAYEVYREALDFSPSLPLDFYVVLIRTSALLGRNAEADVFVDQYRRRGGSQETIAPWTRLVRDASK